MKPITPHDPLDDLIAAALHGELTPAERAQFESRLQTDPAALAAYQEAQAMHDLLEKTHKSAQPDPAFEQRMVSGVRRKLQTEQHRETAWESVLALWGGIKHFVTKKRQPLGGYFGSAFAVLCIILVLAGVALGPITNGIKKAKQSEALQLAHQQAVAEYQAEVDSGVPNPVMKSVRAMPDGTIVTYSDTDNAKDLANPKRPFLAAQKSEYDRNGVASRSDLEERYGGRDFKRREVTARSLASGFAANVPAAPAVPPSGPLELDYGKAYKAAPDSSFQPNHSVTFDLAKSDAAKALSHAPDAVTQLKSIDNLVAKNAEADKTEVPAAKPMSASDEVASNMTSASTPAISSPDATAPVGSATDSTGGSPIPAPSAPAAAPAAVDDRKLIRNAQLDLEVKSFQAAMDQITAQTKAAGGYVDTSNSQKGGNGKLQGTVVVKVLPQNLDDFLLKLRDLGQVQNQSVSTDDVTKDYFDTQARLVNSQKMELQLQDLLKRENGKVSDLLAVERELARVRGDIEQMQGQLKLYDFQVQYATITIQMKEKDLNQTAAYLLKEQDEFSLFATDVEGTFQKARQGAEDFKAQILVANLVHNSGSDVAAELTVMVAPDQIESFLAQVRGLGRVANFTRQTQRVAKDGGDDQNPADQTLTEKDKVQVHLSIRSDDETRKQVALTVVAKAIDVALDAAKTAALANAGVEILSSSLNKTPEGASTAQLTVRVPGKDYDALIAAFKGLGRTASLSIQRNDNSGPGSNGDDAPVIISLSLTDDDAPLQETALTVRADDVDAQSQQIKKTAATNGVEVKASSFERQPDGTELAQMTFRLPMAKYPAFLESVKGLGKVESLTVQRQDRPDQTITDDTAPAEITLQLHNQRDIVAEDTGLWATLRQTFGEGAAALFGSIRVIGVLIAFVAPWLFTLALLAWVGRRIYVWRKNK